MNPGTPTSRGHSAAEAPTGTDPTEPGPPAVLVLEDGTVFKGRSVGFRGESFGEVVFNTSMTGYQEVLTDPSYREQIVAMTYPEIGIYGINGDDIESETIQVSGFVMHHAIDEPSNHRATGSLAKYLAEQKVVAIEDVDTRALTRHLRSRGAMRGAISCLDLNSESLRARILDHPSLVGRDLAKEVTVEGTRSGNGSSRKGSRIVLVDSGSKAGIPRELLEQTESPIEVVRVRYDASFDEVRTLSPRGVLISNGPGDPAPLAATIDLARGLLEHRIPLAGICLGHQILGLALGGTTYKMQFGHRGSNHPVLQTRTGRVMITAQNHGFALDPTSLGIAWTPLDGAFIAVQPDLLDATAASTPSTTMADRLPDKPLIGVSPLGFGPVEITYLSLNDGTLEGLRLLECPALSVQFHPEASPGPHDAAGFFASFLDMVEACHA